MVNNIDLKNKNVKSTFLGAFYIFMGALFFSAKAVLVKMIYIEAPGINHVTLLTLRMGISLPFFLGIAFFNHTKLSFRKSISAKDWLFIAILGFGGYYSSSIFDFWGLEYVTASLERLILFIYPTIVVLISSVVFKRKISHMVFAALSTTYVGIVIVLYKERIAGNSDILVGSFLVFLAAITYACYLVGSERMIFRLGNTLYTSIVMSVASICVLVHFLVTNHISDLNVTTSVVAKAFFMAIFCTVIPSFLIAEGIKIIGAAHAAIIASIGPVSTIFIAHLLLNERLEGVQVLGTMFVIVGVVLVSLYGKRPVNND